VFTKADKESQREVQANMKAMKKALLEVWEELQEVFLTSSLTGMGRDAVLDNIESINETLKRQ
jgi:GTP-binding protein